MGFLMEFAEHWIRRSMENPDERDEKFRKHVQTTREQADKLKATWANPVKSFGSWNSDKNNHKFLQDLTLSRMPGRQDPYQDVAAPPLLLTLHTKGAELKNSHGVLLLNLRNMIVVIITAQRPLFRPSFQDFKAANVACGPRLMHIC